MAKEVKIIINTNNPTVSVGVKAKVVVGRDSSLDPAIQFKVTGSSGIKGDTGLTGPAGATYIHPTNHAISVTTGLQTALDGKVNISQVLTNVPANALFTDTNINTQLPLIDSDVMTGALATNVASAESVKAYVDSKAHLELGTSGTTALAGDTTTISGAQASAISANTSKNTNVTTNLSIGASTTTRTIASSDGTNATIPVATTSVSGVMSTTIFDQHTANVAKVTDANHNVTTNLGITGSAAARTITSSDGTDAVIPIATTSVSGLLSPGLFDEIDANTAKATNVSTNLTATANGTSLTVNSSDGDNVALPAATTDAWGVMTDDMFDAIAANTAKETNVVQTTITGNAGTATALTSGDKTINGNLIVTAGTSGDATLTLKADTDNNDEADNPYVAFEQDGAGVTAQIGFSGANDEYPNASTCTGAITNALIIGATGTGAARKVQIATQNTARVTVLDTGFVGIGTNAPSVALQVSGDLTISGVLDLGITYIKILPRDFIGDDGGRPLAIDDVTSDRFLESHSTYPMFASVEIPVGFKATHVDIYGSGTSAITVYEADINSRTVTSKGTGNIGTQIDITDVTADDTNYLLIEMAQASGEQVNGGKVTIAKA